MRSLLSWGFPWLLCALAAGSAWAAEAPVQVEGFDEVLSHLVGPRPVVHLPWQDLTTQSGGGGWFVRFSVDEQGRVAKVAMRQGSKHLRQQALQAARAHVFTPFERDGRAVAVEFDFLVLSEVADYVGPADRGFTMPAKPRDIRIAMQRTGCFGSCPSYWVEVRGDGQVTYRGFADVLVEGEHRWRVSPAAVAGLVERFRQADYLKLKGHYAIDVSDLPSITTRLSLGRQQKFVYDYGGAMGREMAAQGQLSGPGPAMPEAVDELESAIDAVAGTASWVHGDDNTMAQLRRAHWNFRSAAAGRGLSGLLSECRLALANEFIRAGAPVNAYGNGMFKNPPVTEAVHCGDVGMVRQLVAKGALARGKDAAKFMAEAARHAYPDFIEIGLKHTPKVERSPLLFSVAEANVPDEQATGGARFDPGRVVALLLAAGADINTRDDEGNTALHQAQSGAVAQALIVGGADLNARNKEGATPLFQRFFDEPKQALIAAGADLTARDKDGDTALFYQRSGAITRLLIQAGMDVNARNHRGATPLETTAEEEPALLLLAAGATLPTDPVRLAALTAKAKEREWAELLQRLAAAQPGSP